MSNNINERLDAIDWIEQFVESYHYSMNDDGSINLYDCTLSIEESMDELPKFIRFKKFERVYFDVVGCNLKSMRGFPEEIWDSITDCSFNDFENMEYAPKIIHGGRCHFRCCGMKSLKGSCEFIRCNSIDFSNNLITKFDNENLVFSNSILTADDKYKRIVYNPFDSLTVVVDDDSELIQDFLFSFDGNDIHSLKGLNLKLKGLMRSFKQSIFYFGSKNVDRSDTWNENYIKKELIELLKKDNLGIENNSYRLRVNLVDDDSKAADMVERFDTNYK